MNYHLLFAETAKKWIFPNEVCEITVHRNVFRVLC